MADTKHTPGPETQYRLDCSPRRQLSLNEQAQKPLRRWSTARLERELRLRQREGVFDVWTGAMIDVLANRTAGAKAEAA